jgi:hypothetical protein
MSKIKDSKDGIVNEKRRFFYRNEKYFPINEFRLKKLLSNVQNRNSNDFSLS